MCIHIYMLYCLKNPHMYKYLYIRIIYTYWHMHTHIYKNLYIYIYIHKPTGMHRPALYYAVLEICDNHSKPSVML